MRVLNGIGLLAIGLLISGLTQAEVYQWRDENGNLHFSDEPPENQKSEQVELKPASGYSPPSLHREAGREGTEGEGLRWRRDGEFVHHL